MTRAFLPPTLQLTTHTLANGLRLAVHRDVTSPLAAVNLWYDVGSRHEVAGRTGFAHLFEHLMFQGSANVASGEHFSLLEGVGATLNASTGTDRTNYFETVPVEHFELALWLEADRMGSLDVSRENLDNQRDVVKEEKRQRYDNQPAGTFWPDMLATLFPPGHPYHHAPIGSMEDLDAATLDDVVAFHARWYGPDNAVLSVVGDLDPAMVIERVEHYFGGIAPLGGTPGAPEGSLESLPLPEQHVRDIDDKVSAAIVCPAWRTPPLAHPDHDAVEVALDILGHGRGSRLNRALVVDEPLAVPAESYVFLNSLVGGASMGLGQVEVREGVDRARVVEVLTEQVASLAAAPPTDEELDRAKALSSSRWLGSLGSVTATADSLSRIATQRGDANLINHELDGILAVTAEQVQAAAATYLAMQHAAILTYLPSDPGALA